MQESKGSQKKNQSKEFFLSTQEKLHLRDRISQLSEDQLREIWSFLYSDSKTVKEGNNKIRCHLNKISSKTLQRLYKYVNKKNRSNSHQSPAAEEVQELSSRGEQQLKSSSEVCEEIIEDSLSHSLVSDHQNSLIEDL